MLFEKKVETNSWNRVIMFDIQQPTIIKSICSSRVVTLNNVHFHYLKFKMEIAPSS